MFANYGKKQTTASALKSLLSKGHPPRYRHLLGAKQQTCRAPFPVRVVFADSLHNTHPLHGELLSFAAPIIHGTLDSYASLAMNLNSSWHQVLISSCWYRSSPSYLYADVCNCPVQSRRIQHVQLFSWRLSHRLATQTQPPLHRQSMRWYRRKS